VNFHQFKSRGRLRSAFLCAVTCLWLTACGGGGGSANSPANEVQSATPVLSPVPGSSAAPVSGPSPALGPVPGPSPSPVPDSSPAPNPYPAPTTGRDVVQIDASTQAKLNTSYEVNGSGNATIDVTMPPDVFRKAGDIFSVRGVSANPWRIVTTFQEQKAAHAPNLPFEITTLNLVGNAAPAVVWTPRLEQKQWQSVSSDELGGVLVAADSPGSLNVSFDAGATWSTTNSPIAKWSSVAVARKPYTFGGYGEITIAAVAEGGGIYRYDSGSWTQVGAELGNQNWTSVLTGVEGIVFASFNGPIYGTSTGAAVAGTAAGSTTPLVRGWQALARSGLDFKVAVNQEGEVWISTYGATNWSQRNVVINGTTVNNQWYRVAVSGNTIAVAGRFNSAMYVSRDRGLSWEQAKAPVGNYTGLWMSGNGMSGNVIAATLADGTTPGSVQISKDGGASFSALTLPGSNTNWQSIALSNDANQLIVAGGSPGIAAGPLYTSLGNRTSYATVPGYIGGGQNDYVEIEYLTDGYRVRTSSGGPFTVR
jgi:uncharacterized protein YfiM (DUF2279 family)